MSMLKEVPERWVLFLRHQLNSPMEIGMHAEKDEPALRALAKVHGLEVAGPLEHAYWDMAVKGAPHLLEIWLPVRNEPGKKFIPEIKHVAAYKCMAMEFKRPIEEIGDGWMQLGDQGLEAGCIATHHDREVYRAMDCDNPRNNDIELQLGIR